MMLPKDFYDTYVLPSYEAWRNSRTCELWIFKAVAVNLSQMADYVFEHFKSLGQLQQIGSPSSAGEYRQALRKACPDFGLIWDVADGHKHAIVTRSTRRVTSATQTAARYEGGAFSDEYDQSYDIEGERVVITLDDGTSVPGAKALQSALVMWTNLFRNWGWISGSRFA